MKNAQACDNVTDGEMFEQLMRARNTNFSTEQDQTLAAVEHYYLAKRTNMPFQFMKGAYWGAMDLPKRPASDRFLDGLRIIPSYVNLRDFLPTSIPLALPTPETHEHALPIHEGRILGCDGPAQVLFRLDHAAADPVRAHVDFGVPTVDVDARRDSPDVLRWPGQMKRGVLIITLMCCLQAIAFWVEITTMQAGAILVVAGLLSYALAVSVLRDNWRRCALRCIAVSQLAAWAVLLAVGAARWASNRAMAESLLEDARSFRTVQGRFPRNHAELLEARAAPSPGSRSTKIDPDVVYFAFQGEACVGYRGWLRTIRLQRCIGN